MPTMLGKEYFTMWECTKCGAVHREQGRHKFTLAVEIPPMEDGGCGYSCPFLHSDDDGVYCCEGHGIDAGDGVKIKPGPGCPRWTEGPCKQSNSGTATYWHDCAELGEHTTVCRKGQA